MCSDEHEVGLRIAREMDSEFVVCDLETFRGSYLPFNPSEGDIQSGLQTLRDQKQASFDMQGNLQWEHLTQSSNHDGAKILDLLQDIFDALTKYLPSETNTARRCNFAFCHHPDKPLSGDSSGCNHRIDASFIQSCPNPGDVFNKSGAISAADVSVGVEFKTNKSREDVRDNRMKISAAASHIMNVDARRMFTFGITIEDDEMTLWYFSRSHSAKSIPFNFVQNVHYFIAVALSFMFSSDQEMGYDPCVIRSKDGSDYIYHIGGQGGEDRYFRTRRSIAEYRSLCITGRMTRVWEAIEVDEEQTCEIGTEPVVLKDVWLDAAARTERQIQDEIFRDIRAFSESASDPHGRLQEFPAEVRTHLEQVLAGDRFRDYFLRIVCDYEGRTTRSVAPTALAQRGLFNAGPSISSDDPGFAIPPPTNRNPQQYVPRRQYRVVYGELCKALHDLDSLKAITGVASDCLTALHLLYCAGWVHRDVSSGNILACDVDGTMRGKLADFEYAKRFTLTPGSPDPKMGTPYFMPFEIQSQQYLSQPIRQKVPAVYSEIPTRSTSTRPPVRFNFQHDLESLWWVLLWVITQGLDHPQSRAFAATIFWNYTGASAGRGRVMMEGNYLIDELRRCLHPSVQIYGNSLCVFLGQLCDSYIYREQQNDLGNLASYSQIHGAMCGLLQFWKGVLDDDGDVDIELQPKRVADTSDSVNRLKRGPPGGNGDCQPGESDGSETSQEDRFPKRIR